MMLSPRENAVGSAKDRHFVRLYTLPSTSTSPSSHLMMAPLIERCITSGAPHLGPFSTASGSRQTTVMKTEQHSPAHALLTNLGPRRVRWNSCWRGANTQQNPPRTTETGRQQSNPSPVSDRSTKRWTAKIGCGPNSVWPKTSKHFPRLSKTATIHTKRRPREREMVLPPLDCSFFPAPPWTAHRWTSMFLFFVRDRLWPWPIMAAERFSILQADGRNMFFPKKKNQNQLNLGKYNAVCIFLFLVWVQHIVRFLVYVFSVKLIVLTFCGRYSLRATTLCPLWCSIPDWGFGVKCLWNGPPSSLSSQVSARGRGGKAVNNHVFSLKMGRQSSVLCGGKRKS